MPGENPLRAGRAVSGGYDDSGNATPSRQGRIASLFGGTALRRALGVSALSGAFLAEIAHAENVRIGSTGLNVGTVEVLQLAMFAGVMGAALVSAVFLIRERARTSSENIALTAKVGDLNASLQRAEALLNLRDQRVVVWASEKKKPELIGALPLESGAPEDRSAFLAFGRWLTPRSAAAIEHAVTALREKGIAFDLVVESHSGAPFEVQGRKSAAHVLVRFLSLSDSHRTR
jgi:hypothetical protein